MLILQSPRISSYQLQTPLLSEGLGEFFVLDSPSPRCLIVGGAGAQSVERATPGEKVMGSIPAVAARSLLVGSVSAGL